MLKLKLKKCPRCHLNLKYIKGKGYSQCPNYNKNKFCGFSQRMFREDGLYFIFSWEKTKIGSNLSKWKLKGVLQEPSRGKVNKVVSKFPKPYVLIYWCLANGPTIMHVSINKDFKTGSMSIAEAVSLVNAESRWLSAFNTLSSTREDIEIFIKEWVNGISKPETLEDR